MKLFDNSRKVVRVVLLISYLSDWVLRCLKVVSCTISLGTAVFQHPRGRGISESLKDGLAGHDYSLGVFQHCQLLFILIRIQDKVITGDRFVGRNAAEWSEAPTRFIRGGPCTEVVANDIEA